MQYKYIVDEDVAEMYAKFRCKHCHGRGVIRTQVGIEGTIRRDQPIVERTDYCSCVKKNQKKYG